MGFLYAESGDRANKVIQEKKRQKSIEIMQDLGCRSCPLNRKSVQNPDMEPDGTDEPLVYILGEAPGKAEDDKGKPFMGKAGRLLKKTVPREFKQDVRYNNIVRSRPFNNEPPKWKEIEHCRKSIIEDIERTKPVSIVTLGTAPLKWLTGIDSAKIHAWRGRRGKVRVGNHECWFYPVTHPSYVLRMARRSRPLQTDDGDAFYRDMQRVFDEVEEIPDAECDSISEDGIEFVWSVDDWAEALQSFWEEDVIALDLETNGLRPFEKQSKWLSVALGTKDKTYAISLRHPDNKWNKKNLKKIYDLFEDFLVNSSPTKIFHNLPFDLEWLCDVYGEYIAHEVDWGCSQAQAYVLDQRSGCQSLDALCHLYFGINLKAHSDINVRNLINEPINKVLLYNALDVKYTHKLCLMQRERIIEQDRMFTYNNQVRRCKTLVIAQLRGIKVDTDASKELEEYCDENVQELEEKIQQTNVAIEYHNRFGERLNPKSPSQLAVAFRDILNRTEGKRGYDKYTTNEEALKDMEDEPLASMVLEHRAYTRLKSTFIKPMRNELLWWDGRIHTKYQPYFVITGRLSSREPNSQNFPMRKYPWIRKQFVPDEGCEFLSGDYGQIEARYIAMASKDQNYIDQLWQQHDIHMDWAIRLATDYPKVIGGKKFLDDQEVMDSWRSAVKNAWTFPLFYGSDADACVQRTGIPERIIYKHFEDFWDEFSGVKKWQEELLKKFRELGYVENLTGRRYYYPLKPDKIINYPVQGGAADITVNAMDQLGEAAHRENDPGLQAVLNVHDDLTFCIRKSKMQDTAERILDTMLFPDFDWISVPISVDLKRGKNWYEMEKVGTFNSNEW